MLSPVFKYFKALVVAQLALGRSKCLDTRQWFALPQDLIGGIVALQRWGDNHLTVVRAPVFSTQKCAENGAKLLSMLQTVGFLYALFSR